MRIYRDVRVGVLGYRVRRGVSQRESVVREVVPLYGES